MQTQITQTALYAGSHVIHTHVIQQEQAHLMLSVHICIGYISACLFASEIGNIGKAHGTFTVLVL